jgi:hypothetical protein
MMTSTTVMLSLAAALLASSSGKDDDASASAQDVSQFVGRSTSHPASGVEVQSGTRATRGSIDPCTFFSKAEIESAFGHPYGPPKKAVIFTGPHCMFYSVNTGTISIRAGEAMTRASFDEFRTALADKAEPLSGIGEAAFLLTGTLYVLNNGQQLVISVSGELTPRGRAALLKLGRLGAPRLGR